MGLSMGLRGAPGSLANQEAKLPDNTTGISLWRTLRQQARGPWGPWPGRAPSAVVLNQSGEGENAFCFKTLGHPLLFAKWLSIEVGSLANP